MIVGIATTEDVPGILELEEAGFEHGRWSEQLWTEEVEAADRHVLVGRDVREGTIVAVATFSLVADVAELLRVIVAPDRQRQGIAQRLLTAGLHWAQADGAREVLLEVEDGNAAAEALYSRFGFTPVTRRRDYYGPGADAIVIRRDLARTI